MHRRERSGWDAQSPITIGGILDHGNAASIFNGEIDDSNLGHDDLKLTLKIVCTEITRFERGLMGSWSFDECAGLNQRYSGRRDAQLHGGRWVRSSLVLFSHEDEERARCGLESARKAHLEKRRVSKRGILAPIHRRA